MLKWNLEGLKESCKKNKFSQCGYTYVCTVRLHQNFAGIKRIKNTTIHAYFLSFYLFKDIYLEYPTSQNKKIKLNSFMGIGIGSAWFTIHKKFPSPHLVGVSEFLWFWYFKENIVLPDGEAVLFIRQTVVKCGIWKHLIL